MADPNPGFSPQLPPGAGGPAYTTHLPPGGGGPAYTPQRTFLGHPLGMYVLFFTEMWERFSYYGMRALLILYMVNYFKWASKDASVIYKVYTSFVYVTPIIGGFLADRYLGNRVAVVIGALLMAVGHFLMAFEQYEIFMAALIFLILGNGMFKPNLATQVGRLYPTNDGRRDAAYTIYYMGVNLGAFLAPIACGWLADNTVGGYHSGFTIAGVGMVFGLVIYLLGQPLIKEVDPNVIADPVNARKMEEQGDPPLTEEQAAEKPSVLGPLSGMVPAVLMLGALGMFAISGLLIAAWKLGGIAPLQAVIDRLGGTPSAPWDPLMLGIGGVCLALVAYVYVQVRNGLRDRILAILLLGVFVVFFWAAFEQAGNVQNLWADKNTNRFIFGTPVEPDVYPEAAAGGGGSADGSPAQVGVLDRFRTMFQLKPSRAAPADGKAAASWAGWETPTAWYQSINAIAIFTLGPAFAWLWLWLDRKGWQPSIPMKMFLGLIFMSASIAVMIEAARQEDKVSTVAWNGALPAGVVNEDGKLGHKKGTGPVEPFQAGRMRLENGQLVIQGVLADNDRDLIVEQTAPAAFQAKVKELADASKKITDAVKSVTVPLPEVPPGFEPRYLAGVGVRYRADTRELEATVPMKEKETRALLVAGGDPAFRDAVNKLYVQSSHFRVSSQWLLWSFILATIGELCLSPVGLSMVSKLAPKQFATMLMGVWMLTSAFGNFAAGVAGEVWGTIPPVTFFVWLTGIVAAAGAVLLVIVYLLNKMMHGVR